MAGALPGSVLAVDDFAVLPVEEAVPPPIVRADSGCYWAAEGWDPEERIYAGAAVGMNNHLLAVQPRNADKDDSWSRQTTKESESAYKPQGPGKLQATNIDSDSEDSVGGAAAGTADTLKQKPLHRVDSTVSDGYWDAEAWDPEERIYVGAELGQMSHLMAVQPKKASGGGA